MVPTAREVTPVQPRCDGRRWTPLEACAPGGSGSTPGRQAECRVWPSEAAIAAAAAFVALLVGTLVYLTDRDLARSALIPSALALPVHAVFGPLGLWLPSFTHAMAFSLLTAAVLGSGSRPGYGACAAWWAIDVLFELAQHPSLNALVADGISDLAGPSWAAQLFSNYALRGTFDVGDVIATTGGGTCCSGCLVLGSSL